MKTILLLIILLLALSACSEFRNNQNDKKNVIQTAPKARKEFDAKKDNSKRNITGVLSSGVEYEATHDSGGFTISFDPFIAKKDDIFVSATTQIIAKLYNDKINDESHISIESNIDYTIFKGANARYKIVPVIESSGEISSISITSIF